MKLQKIFLCAAIGLTAFGASLGLLEIGRYIRGTFQPLRAEIKPVRPIFAPAVIVPPDAEFKQPAFYAPPEVSGSDAESCGFDETGDYGLLEENPKGFEDFQTLSVVTRVYSEKYPDGIAVAPTGSLVMTSNEYKFSVTNIIGRRISFVTQTKKGVSYQFDGKFVEKVQPTDEETDYPELKGRLTKWRNGVKIAEAKLKLGEMCGC